MAERKLLKRPQVLSIDDELDRMFPRWQEGRHPDFSGPEGYDKLRAGVKQFAEHILRSLREDLEKAAGAGITEAINLASDSEWYEKKHTNRARRTKAEKDERERQIATQMDYRQRLKEGRLTQEEKMQEMARRTHSEHYHERELKRSQVERKRIEHSQPVLTETSKTRSDDEWPEDLFG